MSHEHDHHHPHEHPAPAPMMPEDAGSQALAEALRSSFVIVKAAMLLMVLAFFLLRFFYSWSIGEGDHPPFWQTGQRRPESLVGRGLALVIPLSN